MTIHKLRLFIKLSRPLFLVGGVVFYTLGISIADYLGVLFDWGILLVGLLWVTMLQLSAQYLNEYFDYPADSKNLNRTFFSGGSGAIGEGRLSRNTALIAAATTLTITASVSVILTQLVLLSPLLILIMVVSVLGAIFYSVPPVRLVTTGYGELLTSILVAFLVPSFAFILQYGELHRLVAMSTFPLTAIHLAMMIIFELPDYASDIKFEKLTLLVRIGWEHGMTLHNVLILSAYLLLGIAMFFGLPIFIALPAFLTFPLGLLEIWQLRRITAGGKPNWNALGLTVIVLLGSMTYLLAYAFWTR
jgi:1,4-dihydroxy-2-naphthoate octaprenyltransferase